MNQANKNFTTNILHLVANIIVGILYTPYLVRELGIVAYGVVPLALVINQYINVISLSLVNALTRFYSVEYRNNNLKKASSYFSTSIVVGILFSLISYPILFWAVGYIDKVFDIPISLLEEAKGMFRLTIASFFVSIISNCINTTLFADNLLDYINYIKILRQLSKFIINIALFLAFGSNIIYVGLSNLISEILVLIMSVWAYSKTRPEGVCFKWTLYHRTNLFTMMAMLIWVLLQRFSDTFLYKIDSILMNVYFGIKMTGIIGAISELGSYITSITAVLSSLLSPILLIAYSKRKEADYRKITVEGAYIIGLFTSLLCGLLCGSANSILGIWLGKEFSSYGNWMIIKISVIPYTTAGALFANSYLYANRNKYPALFSLVCACLNVGLNVLLLHFFHSIIMFLIVCLFFVLIQGLGMNIFFYNKLYSGQLRRIFWLTMKYTMVMCLIAIVTALTVHFLKAFSLVSLIVVYAIIFIGGIIAIDVFFLSKEQRILLTNVIPIYGKFRNALIKMI